MRLRWLTRFSSHESALERLRASHAGPFDPVDLLKKSLPKELPVEITGVYPRWKEGGAFVRFSHDASTTPSTIEQGVRDSLKKNNIKPWFNPFSRVRAHLALGKPWAEDLFRLPSSWLKIEFLSPKVGVDAIEVSQEQLFSIFRPFGRLKEITPQPPDSKILPKYSILEFSTTRDAIMAKNCLHGLDVKSDTDANVSIARLKVGYERKSKTNWAWEWITNHPRIAIPLLAALSASVAVAVFDPIRKLNIKYHIKGTLHLTNHPLYKWFALKANNLWTFHRRDNAPGMSAIFDDRKEYLDQLDRWLMESTDTFIVVQGPRGSGKRELVVDKALKSRNNKLVVDCKKIQEARGESATISAMAESVGYRPVFSWMNSISGLIDLAAQGAAGVKTGFSETLDGQLNQILNSTASALRNVALGDRNKKDKDAHLTDDAYLEAHPEQRPVVVIDNFLHKSQESTIIYDKLAAWAASCTTANVAHVIFLTTDVSFDKSLSKAMPDRVFRQVSLSDCTPELARKYVLSHLEGHSEGEGRRTLLGIGKQFLPPDESEPPKPQQAHFTLDELDRALTALGGRLTDLDFLARRIKAGESPDKAVREIIEQAASEILKMYVLNVEQGSKAPGETDKRWTATQAWTLIKALSNSEDGVVRYNQMALEDAFKSGPGGDGTDVVLRTLEQSELISISSINGRPQSVRPGRPVFLPAFRQLTGDSVLAARLDLSSLTALASGEAGTITKAEEELLLLSQLPGQPAEIRSRINYLLAKVAKSQAAVESLEAKSAELKKTLATEY